MVSLNPTLGYVVPHGNHQCADDVLHSHQLQPHVHIINVVEAELQICWSYHHRELDESQ
jgi:hypothetical protein